MTSNRIVLSLSVPALLHYDFAHVLPLTVRLEHFAYHILFCLSHSALPIHQLLPPSLLSIISGSPHGSTQEAASSPPCPPCAGSRLQRHGNPLRDRRSSGKRGGSDRSTTPPGKPSQRVGVGKHPGRHSCDASEESQIKHGCDLQEWTEAVERRSSSSCTLLA